jgi:hypothetical protein
MLEIADKLPCFIFNDTRLGKGMFDILPAQFIMEYLRGAFTNDHASFANFIIGPGDERKIRFPSKANVIGLCFAFLQLWYMCFIPITPPIQIDRHLISELPVKVWNTCDRLHHMPALGAPLMDLIELNPHKPAAAIFR